MKKRYLILGFVFVLSFGLIFPPIYAPYAFTEDTPESLIRNALVKNGVIYQSYIVNIKELGQEDYGKRYDVSVFDSYDKAIVTDTFHIDKNNSGNFVITAIEYEPTNDFQDVLQFN